MEFDQSVSARCAYKTGRLSAMTGIIAVCLRDVCSGLTILLVRQIPDFCEDVPCEASTPDRSSRYWFRLRFVFCLFSYVSPLQLNLVKINYYFNSGMHPGKVNRLHGKAIWSHHQGARH